MVDEEEDPWLTYRGAAADVDRCIRSLQIWVQQGMPAEYDDRGRRIIRRSVLRAEYRRRLERWPPHQYRLRKTEFDVPTDGWT